METGKSEIKLQEDRSEIDTYIHIGVEQAGQEKGHSKPPLKLSLGTPFCLAVLCYYFSDPNIRIRRGLLQSVQGAGRQALPYVVA